MTLDVLDVPSMAGKGSFLATHCERPDPHDGVVTGCGESSVVLRETESKYGFSMSRPCGGIIRIGLDIHDDSGLVGTRDIDICAGVDEDQCVVIVRLEYGLEVERQSVPGREFPTRRTGPYATTGIY